MAEIQKVEDKKKTGGCLLRLAGILAVLLVATFAAGYFNILYAWGSKQKLEHVAIEAQLLENGDLRITETWVLAMNKRGTPYTNGYKSFSAGDYDGIADLTVYDHDLGIAYTILEDVTDPERGGYPSNSGYIVDKGYEYEVGWFFEPIDSGVRTFTFSYTMTNVATVYNDTAELYVGLIGSAFSLPIQDLFITLRLPVQSEAENPLVWLHTASNGIIEIADPATVTVHASRVPAQTMVECRILFDETSLPASDKRKDRDQKEYIRGLEQSYYAASDVATQYAATAVIASLLLVVIAIFCTRFFAKPKRHGVDVPEYVREAPTNMSLGTARMLHRFYESRLNDNVNGDLLSALVLSMVQKGWLTIEEGTSESKRKNSTVITPQAAGREPISTEEQPLWNIFSVLGQIHGGSFTMAQYTAFGRKEYSTVDSAMRSIAGAIKASFNTHHWVERSYFFKRPSTWIGFCLLVLSLVFRTMIFTNFGVLVFSLNICGLIFLAQSLMHRRLTPEGEQAHQSLLAFRNYLTSFTVLGERAPQEVHLWQEYLIWATVLGCADRVRESIPFPDVKTRQAGTAPAHGAYVPYAYPYTGSHSSDSFSSSDWDNSSGNSFRTLSSMGDSFSRTFQDVYNTASNLARPSGSGGSGGGGGGSSSGGGGGSGSGGGGGVR